MSAVGKTKKITLIGVTLLFVITSYLGMFADSIGSAYAAANTSLAPTTGFEYSNGDTSYNPNGNQLFIVNAGADIWQQSTSNKNQFVCAEAALCGTTNTNTYSITVGSICSDATLANKNNTIKTKISGTQYGIQNTDALKAVDYKKLYGLNCTLSSSTTTFTTLTPVVIKQQQTTLPTPKTTASTPTCEESAGVLDWVFCGLYSALNSITGLVLTDFIMPELKISPLCISSTGGTNCIKGDPTYEIWSSFRLYGDVILVIALLVVVISEAMGGGLIDAYSVRILLDKKQH